MNFIAMIAALLAERFCGRWRDEIRPQRLPFGPIESPAAVLTLVLLPTIAVAVLFGDAQTPLRALLSGCVLFACLGPRDLAADVHALIAARAAGDGAAVLQLTRVLQRGPQPEADHRSLLGTLFVQSHERLFGVLLWFILGGPAGAVLYRCASHIVRYTGGERGVEFADTLHTALAWVPARLAAALFALAGSADDALTTWRALRRGVHPGCHPDWRRHSWTVLSEVAVAALDYDAPGGPAVPASLERCLQEVLRMQLRALLILLAAYALLSTGFLLR
jgi:AmpE protein